MSLKHVILAGSIAATVILTGGLTPAFAASSGGGGSSGGSSSGGSSGGGSSGSGGSAGPPIVCREGWVYDKDQKICVQAQSGLLDDGQLYEQGRALALAGYYGNALAAFDAIQNKHDAMVLTMIGYSTRKQGHFEDGIAYYQQALAIDPVNLDTHEYLGEAYASIGRADLAGVQLDKIEAICGGTTCEQFAALTDFMAGKGSWH
jgi:tetratricopeptide (TPR) repeat protein